MERKIIVSDDCLSANELFVITSSVTHDRQMMYNYFDEYSLPQGGYLGLFVTFRADKIYLWSSSLLIVFDYMISEFLSQTGAIRDTMPAVAVSGTHILARLIDGDSLIVQVRCEVEKKDITLDTALDRHTQISNL